ncbi:MAG TPA: diacylglycerol kinase family lipid kinase [Pseudomonadota bacterium]|nr:diacylglycerol kinase family lipid kinase [Pseudomonadota bacterium]
MANDTTLIVNPMARGGWLKKKWPVIEPILQRTLGPLDIVFTRQVGDGRPLAKKALESGAKLVLAMGGDGTASEVASGLLEYQDATSGGEPIASFGIIPAGTGGDLGRTLGTPRDIEAAAQAIARSPGRLIDAGRIDYIRHNGEPAHGYFINAAGAGVGGLVDMYAAESSRLFGGRAAYFWASLRGTLNYKNAALRVFLDDEPARELRAYLVAVGNGGYFGAGMHFAPEARIDDGLLDVLFVGDLSFVEKVNLSRYIYSGTHISLPKMDYHKARRIRIELGESTGTAAPPPVLLDIDGEAPGRLPATLSVLPQAIRLRG